MSDAVEQLQTLGYYIISTEERERLEATLSASPLRAGGFGVLSVAPSWRGGRQVSARALRKTRCQKILT